MRSFSPGVVATIALCKSAPMRSEFAPRGPPRQLALTAVFTVFAPHESFLRMYCFNSWCPTKRPISQIAAEYRLTIVCCFIVKLSVGLYSVSHERLLGRTAPCNRDTAVIRISYTDQCSYTITRTYLWS